MSGFFNALDAGMWSDQVLPYKVLGTFMPDMSDPKWKAWRVGRQLTSLTAECGLEPHVDPCHGPLHNVPWYSEPLHAEVRKRSFKTKMAEGWHFDGDTTPGSKPDCAIVIWSSSHPTEIQYNGDIWQPKPWEVAVFRNLSVLHRRPADVPRVRWVFRQRVAVPPLSHLELP